MAEFITELIAINNQEIEENMKWDIWLHRRHDLSWEEFDRLCRQPKKPDKPVDFEAAIKESRNILDGFKPE